MDSESPSYSFSFAPASSRGDFSAARRHGLRSAPYQIQLNDSSEINLDSAATAKSALTPLRKHHKLLKDGSGNEVWPELVEQVFINGLRAYSASTISQNHTTKLSDAAVPGRSRLRNAYLVQYLAQYGIERSRKQVASHLQVLKNMWRADGNYANYRLVVGSDPLAPPPPQSSNSEACSTNRHPSPALSCTSSASSSSSSSQRLSFGMTSPGSWSRPVLSPYSSPCSSAHSSPSVMQPLELSHSNPLQRLGYLEASGLPQPANEEISTTTAPSHLGQTPTARHTSIVHRQEPPNHRQQPEYWRPQLRNLTDSTEHASTGFEQAPSGATAVKSHPEPQSSSQHQIHKSISVSFPSAHTTSTTSIAISEIPRATPTPTKLYLFTEGMHPLTINLEKLPGTGVAYLRLQLDIPKSQRPSSYSLRGFNAQLEATCSTGACSWLSIHWKCITQIWGVSSDIDHCSQVGGVCSGIKQGASSPGSCMLQQEVTVAQVPRTASSASYSAGGQVPLSCLGRQEAAVEVMYESPEQAFSRTRDRQPMIRLKFPDSALSSCQLLEQGATMIHQELNFAGQTILRITYTLNRQAHLPAAKLLGWERQALPPAVSYTPDFSIPLPSLNESSIQPQWHTGLPEHRYSMPEDVHSFPYQSFGPYTFDYHSSFPKI